MSAKETAGVIIHKNVNGRVFSAVANLAREVKTNNTRVESAAAHIQALARGVTALFRNSRGGVAEELPLLAAPELAIYTIAHDVAVQGITKHVVPNMLTGGVYDSMMAVAAGAEMKVARVEGAATRIHAIARRIDVATEVVAETPGDPRLHRRTFSGHAPSVSVYAALLARPVSWSPLLCNGHRGKVNPTGQHVGHHVHGDALDHSLACDREHGVTGHCK